MLFFYYNVHKKSADKTQIICCKVLDYHLPNKQVYLRYEVPGAMFEEPEQILIPDAIYDTCYFL